MGAWNGHERVQRKPLPSCSGRAVRAVLRPMHKLLLLRHAKSSWDDATLSDHARPLNRRGQLAAASVRGAMRAMGLAPELALVSSSRRTLQTLEALGPWERPPVVRPLDALYLARAEEIVEVVAGVDEAVECLLVVGHNPGLHDAAVRLAGGGQRLDRELAQLQASFPTGALAVFGCSDWAGLPERGATLERFVAPRDLPEPAT